MLKEFNQISLTHSVSFSRRKPLLRRRGGTFSVVADERLRQRGWERTREAREREERRLMRDSLSLRRSGCRRRRAIFHAYTQTHALLSLALCRDACSRTGTRVFVREAGAAAGMAGSALGFTGAKKRTRDSPSGRTSGGTCVPGRQAFLSLSPAADAMCESKQVQNDERTQS